MQRNKAAASTVRTLLLVCVVGLDISCNSTVSYHIETIAGTGAAAYCGDGGQAAVACLSSPRSVALDNSGNLYVADVFNHRVRKITPQGLIVAVAGDGTGGFDGDGAPATRKHLNHPTSVAVDQNGNLYIADHDNHRIRKVTPDGAIHTVAGAGHGPSARPEATQASSQDVYFPEGIAVDRADNLYIADWYHNQVHRVDGQGRMRTIAGNGVYGFSGDGGPAVAAQLNKPFGVTVDHRGNVYIADSENDRVRRVETGGRIETVAGNGLRGFAGDGDSATKARLWMPYGLALDDEGNLYIADHSNHRIRRISPKGIISTIAGAGGLRGGYGGDGGPAERARLYCPTSIAVGHEGRLFIADQFNHRLRRLTPGR
jgi:sugar lactone lactonase YvrE